MALYNRWVILKNGPNRVDNDFQKFDQPKQEQQQPQMKPHGGEIDKENVNPNKIEAKKEQTFEEFKQNFGDKSIPVELNSGAMIRFLIEDAVKKCFKDEMTKRL